MNVLATGTSTGKYTGRPIFERRSSPSSNWSVHQTDVLSSPALATKIVIFHLQFEVGVEFWFACFLQGQVFKVELLVAIVGVAGKHLESVVLEISFSCLFRFDQEKTFIDVIFRSQCVVRIQFPLLVLVV